MKNTNLKNYTFPVFLICSSITLSTQPAWGQSSLENLPTETMREVINCLSQKEISATLRANRFCQEKVEKIISKGITQSGGVAIISKFPEGQSLRALPTTRVILNLSKDETIRFLNHPEAQQKIEELTIFPPLSMKKGHWNIGSMVDAGQNNLMMQINLKIQEDHNSIFVPLTHFKNLKKFEFGSDPWTQIDWDHIKDLKRLESLRINCRKDANLEPIANVTQLKELYLLNPPLEKGLSYLKGLKALEVLEIMNAEPSLNVIENLIKNLPSLKQITIHENREQLIETELEMETEMEEEHQKLSPLEELKHRHPKVKIIWEH